MNLLFSLTPKRELSFVYDDFSVGQALLVMERCRYTSVPVLRRTGEYVGTLTEGDLLWGVKDRWPDFKTAEQAPLADLPRRSRPYQPVFASMDFSQVMAQALEQNYIPVVDDRGMFIGIVTRKRILTYLYQNLNDPDLDRDALSAAVRGMMD